jgi:carboxymethylenebutenolidase
MQLDGPKKYLVEEFAEDYLENRLNRRDLLMRVLLITGSVTATASVLTALGCGANGSPQTQPAATSTATNATAATAVSTTGAATGATTAPPLAATTDGITIPPTDPAIEARDVRFPGTGGEVLGYLSRPRANGTYPAIIVIHENRGIVEHIRDLTRRYAKENFVALAVDLLSRNGGTERVGPNAVGATVGRTPREDLVADMQAGISYLKTQPYVRSSAFGVTGFCLGGSYAWELAIRSPDIKAAVPYYGTVFVLDDLARVQGAVFAVYASEDPRITGQSSDVEQRLRAAGKTFQVKVYPNSQHQFFNDNAQRYAPEAARAAWPDTLAWFRQHLSA